MIKDLQWFIERIGKRIYRLTETKCKCQVCVDVHKRGLIVHDEIHAQYLFDCQNEMQLEYADYSINSNIFYTTTKKHIDSKND